MTTSSVVFGSPWSWLKARQMVVSSFWDDRGELRETLRYDQWWLRRDGLVYIRSSRGDKDSRIDKRKFEPFACNCNLMGDDPIFLSYPLERLTEQQFDAAFLHSLSTRKGKVVTYTSDANVVLLSPEEYAQRGSQMY